MSEEKFRLRKLGQVRRARVFEEFGGEGRRLLARHAGELMDLCAPGSGAVIA